MFDNGLLKYYETASDRQGFLNVEKLGVTTNVPLKRERVQKIAIDNKSYYVKLTAYSPSTCKMYGDSEVLLSQIYRKAGFNGAVYLPAKSNEGNLVISNDIATDSNVVLAKDHILPHLRGTNIYYLPFLLDTTRLPVDPNDLLTKEAMQEQTRMRILDTASYYVDRHYQNFFYILQHAPTAQDIAIQSGENENLNAEVLEYYRKLAPNKATGIATIDYEVCGNALSRISQGENLDNSSTLCFADFDRTLLSRESMIEEIKGNDYLAELIDKEELAETIGSLDPVGVAQDIKQTTGYEVDMKYADVLAKSYDDMAEILTQ